jgi:hypothetical protein
MQKQEGREEGNDGNGDGQIQARALSLTLASCPSFNTLGFAASASLQTTTKGIRNWEETQHTRKIPRSSAMAGKEQYLYWPHRAVFDGGQAVCYGVLTSQQKQNRENTLEKKNQQKNPRKTTKENSNSSLGTTHQSTASSPEQQQRTII